ncbi:FHA domain-containing protein [Microbacterium sp. ARD32]|uniref:FHA domain-containing protein n=1 Tax=Microbacterium sp. ARD32 TaxID=2962577 RepID=UPI002880C628|nr:FHA domain-containing protein [Microbacterium sp. ARD32]MDT0156122.1 FHA domain-containing protein [Microbacterium sp. ARD32]
MSDVIYRPGDWQVVVEESGIAALPGDAGADKVVALSAMLRDGVPALTEVIDVLSGGAITGLGSFAVALFDAGGTRFAVRGAVTVSTGFEEGFSGEDITTWSERYIAGEPRFEIRIGDAGDGVEYPIRSGVVLTSGIRVGEAFSAPDAVPEPEAPVAVEGEPADAAEVPAEEAQGDDAEADAAPAIDAAPEPEPEADAEPEPEPEPEPEADAEPEPEPGPGPEPESEPEADAEPEPEADAEPETESGDAPSETITPDELLLARSANEPDDAAGEPDVNRTIAPDELPSAAPQQAGDDADAAASAPHVPDAMGGLVTPAPVAAPAEDDDLGDHDGATISVAEARRLRVAGSSPEAPTEALPVIDDIRPPAAGARIRLSTGQVVDLDRAVIIGRKPRSTRASGSTMPHLIAVDSPQSDISRNHLEVRPEGDSVVVVDLHTTNGSTLLRTGSDPVRLHPGEPTLVLGGDVIDVGDGVTVAVEGV